MIGEEDDRKLPRRYGTEHRVLHRRRAQEPLMYSRKTQVGTIESTDSPRVSMSNLIFEVYQVNYLVASLCPCYIFALTASFWRFASLPCVILFATLAIPIAILQTNYVVCYPRYTPCCTPHALRCIPNKKYRAVASSSIFILFDVKEFSLYLSAASLTYAGVEAGTFSRFTLL